MTIVNDEDPLFTMDRKDLLGKLTMILRLKEDVQELLEVGDVKAAKMVLETWWGCACGHRQAFSGCWVCEVLTHAHDLHDHRAPISEGLRGSVYETDRTYLLGEISVLLYTMVYVQDFLYQRDKGRAQALLESWDRHDHGHPKVERAGTVPKCWRCECGWIGTTATWDAQNRERATGVLHDSGKNWAG